MPLLSIETNAPLPNDPDQLTGELSGALAKWLAKPEAYVMIRIHHNPNMRFAGSTEATAYCELKSIGLPEASAGQLSRALCERLQQALAIPPSRVYIEFTDAPRKFWGWNGATF